MTNEKPYGGKAEFDFGAIVAKNGGDYYFEGVVVSVFMKKSGQIRYVVENDTGILHIFSGKQLKELI